MIVVKGGKIVSNLRGNRCVAFNNCVHDASKMCFNAGLVALEDSCLDDGTISNSIIWFGSSRFVNDTEYVNLSPAMVPS